MSIFDGYQQLGQDIVREAVRIGFVIVLIAECLKQGVFIIRIERQEEQQLCYGTAMFRVFHAKHWQVVRILTGYLPVLNADL